VINNAISMIAGGNSVVFAPHPSARRTSQRAVTVLNEAVVAAGGPDNTLTTVAEPNIETAQRLFVYPGIHLLTVTGGEAVIHAARKTTDKRLIAAGAGNPPVVVDQTADIPRAARDIVRGASFDNNIICVEQVKIIAVGRIKEKYLTDALAEYRKRLTRYIRLEIRETADEPCPEGLSAANAANVRRREGERLLQQADERDYLVTLEIAGSERDSPEFAAFLAERARHGGSVTFVIGGSLGLSQEVRQRAEQSLSLSRLTFPHQLTRLLLLEQIYRACRINSGEPYHK